MKSRRTVGFDAMEEMMMRKNEDLMCMNEMKSYLVRNKSHFCSQSFQS